MAKLTPKQEQFCQEYVVDLNATQAAIRAGYSKKTAESQGSTLLRNPKVAERIGGLRAEVAARNDVTVDRVIQEYAKLAFADPTKFFKSTVGGDPYIDASEATPHDWAAVTSIQCEDYMDGRGEDAREVKKVKITLADKKGALDSLAKHLGMFKDKESSPMEVVVNVGAANVLDKVYSDEDDSEGA